MSNVVHLTTAFRFARVRSESRYEVAVHEVRGRAAEILAAVGAGKLRRIALFRAKKWAEIAAEACLREHDGAAVEWVRAAEWSRIGRALPSPTP